VALLWVIIPSRASCSGATRGHGAARRACGRGDRAERALLKQHLLQKVPAVADTSAARIRTYCAPKQLLRRLQGILPVQVEVLAVPRTHLLDATRCKEQSIVDKCTFVDGVKLECLLVKPGNMRIVVKWDLLVSQP